MGGQLNENKLLLKDCDASYAGSNRNSEFFITNTDTESYTLNVNSDSRYCIYDRTTERPKVHSCTSDNKSYYSILIDSEKLKKV